MASRPDSDGAAFCAALLAAAGRRDPVGEVLAVLKLWRGERVYLPKSAFEQRERPADVARRMLAGGVGPAAASLVAQRCGCSLRTARRAVAQAAATFAKG